MHFDLGTHIMWTLFVCVPLGCCSEDEESPAESGGRAAVEARVEGEAAAAAVNPTWLLRRMKGHSQKCTKEPECGLCIGRSYVQAFGDCKLLPG